ncbi:MAG: transcriptional regulator [bacterium]|nr:transcriptional regulator [bacterium]
MIKYKNLDPTIHAPLRLAIMTILVAVKEADFSFLKNAIETSDGNLGNHLGKLEHAGYISVRKRFVKRKPRTSYSVSTSGRAAYKTYIQLLEQCIKRLK